MNELIEVIIILAIVIFILSIGGILLGWKAAIHRENGIHDFGVTSNNQKKWFMETANSQNSWLGMKVEGKYSGEAPQYGQVVYYRNKAMNIPVFVYGIRKKEKQYLSLKLFGIRVNQLKSNGILTNVRKDEQIRSNQKINAIDYPIIVKRRITNLLLGLVMSIIGAVFMISRLIDFQFTILTIFIMIIGTFNILCGGIMLKDYFTYRIEITENAQMIINVKGKKLHYRIGELNYTITATNTEQYLVIIKDGSSKELLRMDSKDRNGLAAYQVIKEAIMQKNTEELYRSLLCSNYYLPLTEEGYIIEHIPDDPSEMRLSIFDSEGLLEQVIDYSELAGNEVVSLEEAIQIIKNFSTVKEIRIVKKDDHGKVYYYTITKEIWNEMKDLGKVS